MLTTLTSVVRRTRQHHAIEHATLHLLAERFPGRSMGGLSDPGGFTLAANVPEESVRRAVGDAMLRLQAGESGLAIHPNCGTNLAATSLLLATAATVAGTRRHWSDRFLLALVLVLPIVLYAPVIGRYLQGFTTLATVGDRWITSIRPINVVGAPGYRVTFE